MKRVLILALALLLLALFAPSFPPPSPQEASLRDCPYHPSDFLNLNLVENHGFDQLGWYHPGWAPLVGLGDLGPVRGDAELNWTLHGEPAPAYRMHLPVGNRAYDFGNAIPSYAIELPGPGCWELTLRFDGKEQTVGVLIQPDRPNRLAVIKGLPGEYGVETTLHESEALIAEIQSLLRQGKATAPPTEAIGIPLKLYWNHTSPSRLLFLPASDDSPALLAVPASLPSGGCGDAIADPEQRKLSLPSVDVHPLYLELPKTFAAFLERSLPASVTPSHGDGWVGDTSCGVKLEHL